MSPAGLAEGMLLGRLPTAQGQRTKCSRLTAGLLKPVSSGEDRRPRQEPQLGGHATSASEALSREASTLCWASDPGPVTNKRVSF